MTDKITVQQLADAILAPEYQQPVKTITEAMDGVGWVYSYDEETGYHPTCCGQKVSVNAMLGYAYFAQCEACRKFIADVTGPQYQGTAAVRFPDGENVDLNTDKIWVCGKERT